MEEKKEEEKSQKEALIWVKRNGFTQVLNESAESEEERVKQVQRSRKL